MLVSYAWLRALVPLEQDPAEVAEALTARGLTLDAMSARGDDTVLEIDVPANRPDCLGHRGIAREIAAAFGLQLPEPERRPAGGGGPLDVTVSIEDPELCPRYTASVVRRVEVGPSPDWAVARLEACGLRSINNVVDISNLVMLELGNPIHFFDLRRVAGPAIVVRRAREGERLTTLDGIERRLAADMLVIADEERPVALAGIIGGADSEIRDDSRDVLVEAAYFEPRQVRWTARRLGVPTDASHRFERGVDPDGPLAAQALAVRLLQELAGGSDDGGFTDAYPSPVERPSVELRTERVRRLMGYLPSDEMVESSLAALRLDPRLDEAGRFTVSIPSWRVDLTREADLVEEVGRHLGYQRIPSPSVTLSTALVDEDPRLAVEERTRDLLAHQGFLEAISYAMRGPGDDDPFVPEGAPGALKLSNPLSEPMSVLRRSLMPGLLEAGDRNLRRGNADVRLFEVGRVFLAADGDAGFPAEPVRAGVLWTGSSRSVHWSTAPRAVTLPDLAGVVEHLLLALGRVAVARVERSTLPGLHPGRASRWSVDGQPVAWGGEVHPELAARLDATQPIFVAEIELDPFARAASPVQYVPVPRVPGVSRDLALVLDPGVAWGDVEPCLHDVESPAPVRFSIVDRYAGEPLEPGQVSLTLRLSLRPATETLTDEQSERYRAALIERLTGLPGVALRG